MMRDCDRRTVEIDGRQIEVATVQRYGRLVTRLASAGRLLCVARSGLPVGDYADLGSPHAATADQLDQLAELFDRHATSEAEAERRFWPVQRVEWAFGERTIR
jgi:hypothetical protein